MFLHAETDERLALDGDALDRTVYRADSTLAKAVGVMGRRGVPADAALVFELTDVTRQSVHMVGVRAPLRVWWVRDGRIEHTDELAPWTGYGAADADMVVELPPSAPAGAAGDAVTLE